MQESVRGQLELRRKGEMNPIPYPMVEVLWEMDGCMTRSVGWQLPQDWLDVMTLAQRIWERADGWCSETQDIPRDCIHSITILRPAEYNG